LYIYVSKTAAAKAEVAAFAKYFIDNNEAITLKALFVPLSADQKTASAAAVSTLGQ
jgi:hypothetical protein